MLHLDEHSLIGFVLVLLLYQSSERWRNRFTLSCRPVLDFSIFSYQLTYVGTLAMPEALDFKDGCCCQILSLEIICL